MIRKNQQQLNRLNALSDGVLVLLSYLFATWLWLVMIKGDPNMALVDDPQMFLVACVYAGWAVLVMACMRIYRVTRIHKPEREIGGIVAANAVALLTAAAALYLFRLQEFSRGVLGVFYLTSCALLCAKRVALRRALRRLRAKGYNLKHILVVGGGELARRYIETVRANEELGIHVAERIACTDDLTEALESRLYGEGIDEVVAALEPSETGRVMDLIRTCEKCGTKISVVPFYNDVISASSTIDTVGSIKLIQLRATPLDEPFNALVKRAFDIAVSALLLVLLSPLLLCIAIAIRASSPGAALFKQERIGLNKKPFTMYKFRSMRVNSEENTAWSAARDDRRTAVGSFLRKTSLDELPQLVNVLRGEMSLVGPRPEIPYFVERFRETVPLYMVKCQVRPGMTGWAQIHGLRGDTSIPDRVKHDIWYIENWSFGLDLYILLRTAFGGMLNAEELGGARGQEPHGEGPDGGGEANP